MGERSATGLDGYAAFDVVGIAASTGGLQAVSTVLGSLPPDFPSAVLIVLHRSSAWGDGVPGILARRTCLPVRPVQDGSSLEAGTVYVAPPDRQVLLSSDLALTLGRAQGCRADDLFVSLADAFEARTLGVVLTGRLNDGAKGAEAVKARGGRMIAQDRHTSTSFGMPAAAISTGCVDWVLPLESIGQMLVSLVMWPGAADLLRVSTPHWAIPTD
jgi:two-component system chemotaxis response regulator CheB